MGHDEDFADYAGARWRSLVKSAVLLGCSPAEAEDLAQTVLVRCYASWRKVSRATNRDAYVYRMLVNCHRDSRRRRWIGERPTASIDDAAPRVVATPDHASDTELSDTVRRALDALSPPLRQVVVLRFWADLSTAAVADALGIPEGTVKSRTARALAELGRNPHLVDTNEGVDG